MYIIFPLPISLPSLHLFEVTIDISWVDMLVEWNLLQRKNYHLQIFPVWRHNRKLKKNVYNLCKFLDYVSADEKAV
jgi:hypothetical protein